MKKIISLDHILLLATIGLRESQIYFWWTFMNNFLFKFCFKKPDKFSISVQSVSSAQKTVSELKLN